jgi:hypothetical protein
MAGGTFRLQDIHQVVNAVAGRAQFPLADATALETALGGHGATVALGAEHHQASEVHQIPADYFPIESAADLFTKLAHLRSANGDLPEGVSPVKRLPGPPPDLAGSLPPFPPADARVGPNVPSARPAQADG